MILPILLLASWWIIGAIACVYFITDEDDLTTADIFPVFLVGVGGPFSVIMVAVILWENSGQPHNVLMKRRKGGND